MVPTLAFLAIAVIAILILRAINRPYCERRELGYKCRGAKCECKKVNYE